MKQDARRKFANWWWKPGKDTIMSTISKFKAQEFVSTSEKDGTQNSYQKKIKMGWRWNFYCLNWSIHAFFQHFLINNASDNNESGRWFYKPNLLKLIGFIFQKWEPVRSNVVTTIDALETVWQDFHCGKK